MQTFSAQNPIPSVLYPPGTVFGAQQTPQSGFGYVQNGFQCTSGQSEAPSGYVYSASGVASVPTSFGQYGAQICSGYGNLLAGTPQYAQLAYAPASQDNYCTSYASDPCAQYYYPNANASAPTSDPHSLGQNQYFYNQQPCAQNPNACNAQQST